MTHATHARLPFRRQALMSIVCLVALVASLVAPAGTLTYAGPAVAVVEQTDPSLAFQGSWTSWSNAALSGGSYHYANTAGTSVTLAFQGTGAELVARKGPEFGQARVYVDGTLRPELIDLYASTNQYQQTVFFTGTLADGPHSVRVEWAGTRNPAAKGTYVGIDAFRVTGTVLPAPVRIEQSDPQVQYTGAWQSWSSGALSAGTYAFTNSTGYVDASFQGSRLRILGRTGPEFGQARVYVDGADRGLVTFYAPTDGYQKAVYVQDLAPGVHTVRLEWTGSKEAASSGTYVCLDAFEITNATPPTIVGSSRFEQTDVHHAYTGTWSTWANASLSGGSYAYTNSKGASADIVFEGSRLDLVARTGPEFGIALVTVDGGQPRALDLYSPQASFARTVYSTWNLTPGPHLVRISWTGTKNSLSSGTYIGIDAADVIVATPPPMVNPAVVEQSDARFSYGGVWHAWSSPSLSGGSYRYASGTDQVGMSFTGTRLDVYARTGPQFGIVSVMVDDHVYSVDLYAPVETFQTRVFSTWDLPSGPHAVRLIGTGRKNALSSGTYFGIDAVWVAGTLTSSPIEEVDYRILRTGAWSTWANSALSGGSYCYSNTSGSFLDVAFEGTKFDLIARMGPEFGIATVSIDGAAPVDVSLYRSQTAYRQTVFTSQTLVTGAHTARISWSGRKDSRSTGTYVNVDAVAVSGVLKQATRRFEETNPWLVRTGAWSSFSEAGHSGGAHTFTSQTGGSLWFSFTGNNFKWIARREPWLGKADVSVDGVLVANDLDLYSSDYVFQQVLFDSGDLTMGEHQVSITCTGLKSASALGTYISADAFDIAGTLNQPPNTFTISGQGWGHSIGLSQYGAKGFAENGSTYDQILAWYYQGTRLGAPPQPADLVKVHLQKSRSAMPSWVIKTGDPSRPTVAYDPTNGNLQMFGQIGGTYIIQPHPSFPNGNLVSQAVYSGGVWYPDASQPQAHFMGPVLLASPTGGPGGIEFYSTSLVEVVSVTGPFDRTNVRWRGAMEFRSSAVGTVLVNHVTMDQYLYGVVPRESPSSWHMEALKAQAVAARSYAYDAVSKNEDLWCTTMSQVYGGQSRGSEIYEATRSNDAVNATSNQYVLYGSQVVEAFFSSSSGGHTANIEDVWVKSTPQPYYRGMPDPYGVGTVWSRVYTPQTLAADLDHGGAVVSLAPEHVASGHVRYITIRYSDGTSSRITGDSFRSKLGLNSTHFQTTQR